MAVLWCRRTLESRRHSVMMSLEVRRGGGVSRIPCEGQPAQARAVVVLASQHHTASAREGGGTAAAHQVLVQRILGLRGSGLEL